MCGAEAAWVSFHICQAHPFGLLFWGPLSRGIWVSYICSQPCLEWMSFYSVRHFLVNMVYCSAPAEEQKSQSWLLTRCSIAFGSVLTYCELCLLGDCLQFHYKVKRSWHKVCSLSRFHKSDLGMSFLLKAPVRWVIVGFFTLFSVYQEDPFPETNFFNFDLFHSCFYLTQMSASPKQMSKLRTYCIIVLQLQTGQCL